MLTGAGQYQQPINKATYAAAFFNVYVSYFFVLQGSASKIVSITRFGFSGTQTTGGQRVFGAQILTGVSGGTPTLVTPAFYDSQNPTASAIARIYTSGATPAGTAGQICRGWTLFMPAPADKSDPSQIDETIGRDPDQKLVLRNANEFFALMLVGGAIPGAAISGYCKWTEASKI